MTREMTPEAALAIQQPIIRPVTLVFLDFPDEPIYVSSHTAPISFDGNIFLGVGDLGTVTAVEETASLKASKVDLTLSGIPRVDEQGTVLFSAIQTVLSKQYQGRPVKIWQAFMSTTTWQLIADPVLVWIGRMDTPQITASQSTLSVQLTAEHELTDMDKPRVRRLTNSDQQYDYPGDRGLEYIPALQEKEIVWGREFTR